MYTNTMHHSYSKLEQLKLQLATPLGDFIPHFILICVPGPSQQGKSSVVAKFSQKG